MAELVKYLWIRDTNIVSELTKWLLKWIIREYFSTLHNCLIHLQIGGQKNNKWAHITANHTLEASVAASALNIYSYTNQGCMQNILSVGENISVFLSSMQRTQVPIIHETRPHPTCTTLLTKIPRNFFFHLEGREGNSHGKWNCYGYHTVFWSEYSNKSHTCKRRAGCYQVHCM